MASLTGRALTVGFFAAAGAFAFGDGRFAGFAALGLETFCGLGLLDFLEVFNAALMLRGEPLNLVEAALEVKDLFAELDNAGLQPVSLRGGQAGLPDLRLDAVA
ncbi:MAG TPA: hypothetical protein PLS03_15425, partial [Terrimicrobiaceae bacterium]|nr:hypothetical protein [Terrimicrobiaceae bacterium]